MPDHSTDDPVNPNPLSIDRSSRKIDSKKKIRVLVRFQDDSIFEGFTYDISSTGIFIICHSQNAFKKAEAGTEQTFFIEYDLDTMIECKGILSRIDQDNSNPLKRGFAMAISEINEKNRVLLETMIRAI